MDTVPTPPPQPLPTWCDQHPKHAGCAEREQHESPWRICVSETELILIRARLCQIWPAAGDRTITYVELEFTEEQQVQTWLLQLDSLRIFNIHMRRLAQLAGTKPTNRGPE